MQKKYFCYFIFTVLMSIVFLVQAADRNHMRNNRYCEIILGKNITTYQVYNTWGLNDCPEKIWVNVNAKHIKKETGVHFVHLNGPRYWVIDGIKNTKLINSEVKVIDGLSLREAGVLHLGLLSLLENKPYKTHEVTRHTTWVYDAGKPVYELIAPNGDVFVMQSYSIQTIAQTIESLSQLGSKLTLPKGWHFKTGIILKTEMLQAIDNKAVVVQDNVLNTYQKATHDFLKENKFS